jgi:hypothetical protein
MLPSILFIHDLHFIQIMLSFRRFYFFTYNSRFPVSHFPIYRFFTFSSCFHYFLSNTVFIGKLFSAFHKPSFTNSLLFLFSLYRFLVLHFYKTSLFVTFISSLFLTHFRHLFARIKCPVLLIQILFCSRIEINLETYWFRSPFCPDLI